MITIIISQHSIYNVYVLIISHSFHSCKVGSLPEASVVEVLSISPRSEESPPGVRSAFSCLHPRNQAPFFGTVTLRISFFWGGGMVWVWWGEIHDLFFHGRGVMFHICAGNSCNQRLNIYLREPLKQNWTQGFFKVILTCKVVTYSKRLQRFGKKLFLQFCMKNCSYS